MKRILHFTDCSFLTWALFFGVLLFTTPLPTQADSLGEGSAMKGQGKIVVTEVTRRKGILTVKGYTSCEADCKNDTNLILSYLLDTERGVKYFPIQDGSSDYLLSKAILNLEEGQRFWAKYASPPPEVTSIDLYVKDVEPIEGLPIIDK